MLCCCAVSVNQADISFCNVNKHQREWMQRRHIVLCSHPWMHESKRPVFLLLTCFVPCLLLFLLLPVFTLTSLSRVSDWWVLFLPVCCFPRSISQLGRAPVWVVGVAACCAVLLPCRCNHAQGSFLEWAADEWAVLSDPPSPPASITWTPPCFFCFASSVYLGCGNAVRLPLYKSESKSLWSLPGDWLLRVLCLLHVTRWDRDQSKC